MVKIQVYAARERERGTRVLDEVELQDSPSTGPCSPSAEVVTTIRNLAILVEAVDATATSATTTERPGTDAGRLDV